MIEETVCWLKDFVTLNYALWQNVHVTLKPTFPKSGNDLENYVYLCGSECEKAKCLVTKNINEIYETMRPLDCCTRLSLWGNRSKHSESSEDVISSKQFAFHTDCQSSSLCSSSQPSRLENNFI